jgi:hypothetical protein
LFGPAAAFSDHKRGETIKFREAGQVKEGTILWVRAPGPAIVGGRNHPVIYVVEVGEVGFPSMVPAGDVIEGM